MANPALVLILLLVAAGYASARLRVFPEDAADVLNRFVLYVCLPATILLRVPGLRFRSDLVVLAAMPWFLLGLVVALVLLASKAFGWRREVTGALLLCVPLGNTSFLGFPMLEALVSPEAVRLAVVYDQLGSFVMLATFGLVVQARYGGVGEADVRTMLRRIATFPPFLALVSAIAISPFGLPAAAEPVLERVGGALVPLAMFAVGLKTRIRPPVDRGPFVFGLVVKMLVLPLVAWGVVTLLGTAHDVARVAVFESAVPPMITAGALAMMAGLAPELSAALVGYGIVLSMATLPAWAAVLR